MIAALPLHFLSFLDLHAGRVVRELGLPTLSRAAQLLADEVATRAACLLNASWRLRYLLRLRLSRSALLLFNCTLLSEFGLPSLSVEVFCALPLLLNCSVTRFCVVALACLASTFQSRLIDTWFAGRRRNRGRSH